MNTIKQKLQLTGLLFLLPILTIAQQSDFVINRDIELKGNTSDEQITIDIEADCPRLSLKVMSIIQAGVLKIEIIDPAGVNQGSFSVESQISGGESQRESVEGQINKMIKDPIAGTWVIRIKSTKAHGRLRINTLIAHPKMNN